MVSAGPEGASGRTMAGSGTEAACSVRCCCCGCGAAAAAVQHWTATGAASCLPGPPQARTTGDRRPEVHAGRNQPGQETGSACSVSLQGGVLWSRHLRCLYCRAYERGAGRPSVQHGLMKGRNPAAVAAASAGGDSSEQRTSGQVTCHGAWSAYVAHFLCRWASVQGAGRPRHSARFITRVTTRRDCGCVGRRGRDGRGSASSHHCRGSCRGNAT